MPGHGSLSPAITAARRRWSIAALACLVVLAACVASASAATPVSPAGMDGWVFANDSGGQDPSASFADMPLDPLGTGSLRITTTDANEGQIAARAVAPFRFDELTKAEYSTYRSSVDAGNNLAIALQFNADYDVTDGNTAWQGRLVFEPYQTGASVPQDTWQTWDALAGKWWASGAPGNGTCPQSNPCTLTQLLAVFPDAGMNQTQPLVILKAGSSWPGFDGRVDGLTLGVGGTDTTWDFEPECSDACHVVQATGDDAFPGTYAYPKKTIQAGVDATELAGMVLVGDGTYQESVTVEKGIGISGAGPTRTIIEGPKTAPYTVSLGHGAGGAYVEFVTITRDGNNPVDWASNANSYGIKMYGGATQLLDSVITGNRNGVYVESGDGIRIKDNDIVNNRTGVHVVNDANGLGILNNRITGNWTMGVLFRDEVFSPNPNPLNTTKINDNDLSGNWYSAIEARTLLTNTIDAERNWFGTLGPTAVAGTSGEPGYTSQIPVAFGGSAVPPATSKSVVYDAANTSNPVDYTPFLCSGEDTYPTLVGFDPVGTGSCLGGFFAPIDMGKVNTAKGGQTIPVKVRLTDSNGDPVATNPGLTFSSAPSTACSATALTDAVELFATAASDWKYVGDGVWQYNWKTPKGAGCKRISVSATGADNALTALFSFK